MLDQLRDRAAPERQTVLQYTTLMTLHHVNGRRLVELRREAATASGAVRERLECECKVREFVVAPFIANEIGNVP